MKAASLGHHYLAVKSSNNNDSFFGGGRHRNSPKNRTLNSQTNQNRQLTSTTEPISRRTTTTDEPTVPSVAFFKRSVSDTTNSVVFCRTATADTGKYRSAHGRECMFCF